jgi:uncharacterized protein YeaO (DUF488 family)
MSNLTPEAQAELEKMQQKWQEFRTRLDAELGAVEQAVKNLAAAAGELDTAEQLLFMRAAGSHMDAVLDSMNTNFGAMLPAQKGRPGLH